MKYMFIDYVNDYGSVQLIINWILRANLCEILIKM